MVYMFLCPLEDSKGCFDLEKALFWAAKLWGIEASPERRGIGFRQCDNL
jgi:hypothetical protein